MKNRKKTNRSLPKGFTLLEVLVVVLIIGLIAALVIPNIVGKPDEARVEMAKVQMHRISEALTYYRIENSHYPSTDQGLVALVTKPNGFPEPQNWGPDPYMKKIPQDPWGNNYIYENNGTEFEIICTGSDGREGGEGLQADIHYSKL